MKSNLLHQRLLFAAATRGRGECRDRLVTAGVLPRCYERGLNVILK